MATIRLTGAQATRVREALARFMEVHPHFELEEDDWVDGGEGHHLPVETLVEDILNIALPDVKFKGTLSIGTIAEWPWMRGFDLPPSQPQSAVDDRPEREDDEPVY